MTKLVVYHTGIREFHLNRIFDPSVVARFPGALPMVRLHRTAAEAGITMITSDVYLKERRGEQGLLFSDMHSKAAEDLVQAGLAPAVSLCAESPLVAYDFYHQLERYSRFYPHVFYFRGMKERVTSPTTIYHVLFFPQSRREMVSGLPAWEERGFLTMVASNKRAFPRRRVSNIRDLRREWIRRRDPWMASDLYAERLRAIGYFSGCPDFHLYGHGWTEFIGDGGAETVRHVTKAYRGSVPDKISTLSAYKFSLCFENTRFPGYVTEKIFDAFFAGSIPVYYGAPDITDFVPAGTFVDFSSFRDFGDLEEYLRAMTGKESRDMIDRIRTFLASKEYEKFHEDFFAKSVVEALLTVACAKGIW